MKRKSILLVMTSLNTGGIATAIKNMIASLPKEKFDIDLLLFKPDDNYSPNIHGLTSAGKYMLLTAINQAQSFSENKLLGMLRLFLGGITRVFGHEIPYKILLSKTKNVQFHYDVAISCTQSGPLKSLYGGCNEFVLSKVSADLKITYIHCDYKEYGLNSPYSHKIYKAFDRIAAVSQDVRKCFLNYEPGFAKKTFVSSNFHDYERIRKKSEENSYEYRNDLLNVVTVARFGKEKGHLRMLHIINRLVKSGLCFRWHIVGGDRNTAPVGFIDVLEGYHLEDYIVFHGNQDNPYRFMKNADLLLIPSYHEAAPMVYEEARCLNLPVLTTRTLSADTLVEAEGIGIVCENDDDAIEVSLRNVISNPECLEKYRNHQDGCDNSKALKEFYKLID